jgi:hypothetical protein
MKVRISWPTGIIIAIIAFMVFILSFVYKVTFLDAYDHHLVSEDYYNDELNYQEEIDKLNNAAALVQNVRLVRVANGIEVIFPSEVDPDGITGTISFKRASTSRIDFDLPIALNSHVQVIEKEHMVPGLWNVRIDWKYKGTDYLLKEKFEY